MIIAVLVVLGLVFGSFINALVWRLHEQDARGEGAAKKGEDSLSITRGHSMCSHCHHPLAPKDLVPVLSWLYLRGKCRYCRVKIQDNPLVEVLLPVLFVISYLAWPLALHGVGLYQFYFWLVFLVGFMALAVYDLRWFLLPNRIIYPLIGLAMLEVLGTLVFFHGGWHTLAGAAWGVAFVSGIFYVIFQVSDGQWIGGGDVKLGIVLGLLVGGPLNGLVLIFIASMLGTLVALPLLLAGKASRTSKLPFGPYLLLATAVVTLYGTSLVDWYNRLFGLN